jgi:hypothetical protein
MSLVGHGNLKAGKKRRLMLGPPWQAPKLGPAARVKGPPGPPRCCRPGAARRLASESPTTTPEVGPVPSRGSGSPGGPVRPGAAFRVSDHHDDASAVEGRAVEVRARGHPSLLRASEPPARVTGSPGQTSSWCSAGDQLRLPWLILRDLFTLDPQPLLSTLYTMKTNSILIYSDANSLGGRYGPRPLLCPVR